MPEYRITGTDEHGLTVAELLFDGEVRGRISVDTRRLDLALTLREVFDEEFTDAEDRGAARLARLLRNRVVYVVDGTLCETMNLLPEHEVPGAAAYFATLPGLRVLNTLPFDEALAVYQAHGGK